VHENRSWNDVYLLHAFLMYNPAFEIVFFDDYFRRFHRAEIEAIPPKFLRNSGGAIWIRRLPPARAAEPNTPTALG